MSLEDKLREEIFQKGNNNGRIESIEKSLKEGKNPYNPSNIEFLLDYSGQEMTDTQKRALMTQLPDRVVKSVLDKEIPGFKKKSEKELSDTVAPVYSAVLDELSGLMPESLIQLAYETPAYEIDKNEKHNKIVKIKKGADKLKKMAADGDVKAYMDSIRSKIVKDALATYGEEDFLKNLINADYKAAQQEFEISFYDTVQEGDKVKLVYNPKIALEYLKSNEGVAEDKDKPKIYAEAGKVYSAIIGKIIEDQQKAQQAKTP